MKKRMWIHLVMAVLVAGLFMTVSCGKKTVVTEPTMIEDKDQMDAEKAKQAAADEAARIAEEKLADQKAAQEALERSKAAAAKKRFENQDIHFKYDSSELSSMAKLILKEKAAWLKANPGYSVTIEGHCDERGTTEYNLALGERRANAAKSYMINLGIAASRMDTISYGEERPKNPGSSEEAYRQNRRAHFGIN